MTRDPIGYQNVANFYLYVDNAPTQFIDPYGLERNHWFMQGGTLVRRMNALCGSLLDAFNKANKSISNIYRGKNKWWDLFTTEIPGGSSEQGSAHGWLHAMEGGYDYNQRMRDLLSSVESNKEGCCGLFKRTKKLLEDVSGRPKDTSKRRLKGYQLD